MAINSVLKEYISSYIIWGCYPLFLSYMYIMGVEYEFSITFTIFFYILAKHRWSSVCNLLYVLMQLYLVHM